MNVFGRQVKTVIKVHIGAQDISMAQQSPSGSPCNSRSMYNDKTIITRYIGRLNIAEIIQQRCNVKEPASFYPEVVIILYRDKFLFRSLDQFLVFLVHKNGLRLAIIQVKDDLVCRKPPVNREYDRPQRSSRTV